MPKIKKPQYQQYRQKLQTQKVKSFIDQFDRTFTSCTECTKKDCEMKSQVNEGCMVGEPRADILKKIKREGK